MKNRTTGEKGLSSQLFRPDTVKMLRTLAMNKVKLVNEIAELRKQYPDEYVAFHAGEVVGHSKDRTKLKADLGKKFETIDHIAIQFVCSREVQLIL